MDKLLDMLPLLTAFAVVLLVVCTSKGGDGDERWERFSNDPRQQTKAFTDRLLRGIAPKR
jgi:hypothetical protein